MVRTPAKQDYTLVIIGVVVGFVGGVLVGWLSGGGANFVDNKLRDQRMHEFNERMAEGEKRIKEKIKRERGN